MNWAHGWCCGFENVISHSGISDDDIGFEVQAAPSAEGRSGG